MLDRFPFAFRVDTQAVKAQMEPIVNIFGTPPFSIIFEVWRQVHQGDGADPLAQFFELLARGGVV